MSILYVILYGITAPFGYIGGVLSSISEELPFVLMTLVFIVCLFLVEILGRLDKEAVAVERIGNSRNLINSDKMH